MKSQYRFYIHMLFLFFAFQLVILPSNAQVSTPLKGRNGEKLNIIFIMSDDHSQRAISCYDTRFGITTPFLDGIASEGLIFENSFVGNSISGPGRASLLTGKHSHKHGFISDDHQFYPEQQTLPKLLQEAGYQTAIFGKWHLNSDPVGFDYWEILPGEGDYYSPEMYDSMERKTYPGEYVTDLITDKSIEWISSRDANKPFMLFISHKAAHRNLMPKIDDLHAFENKLFPLPDNFFDDYTNRHAASEAQIRIGEDFDMTYDFKVKNSNDSEKTPLSWMYDYTDQAGNRTGTYGRMLPDQQKMWDAVYDSIRDDFYKKSPIGEDLAKWKYQRYIKDYLKTAKGIDDNIGKLISYLSKNNLLENTIIIYYDYPQSFLMTD